DKARAVPLTPSENESARTRARARKPPFEAASKRADFARSCSDRAVCLFVANDCAHARVCAPRASLIAAWRMLGTMLVVATLALRVRVITSLFQPRRRRR